MKNLFLISAFTLCLTFSCNSDDNNNSNLTNKELIVGEWCQYRHTDENGTVIWENEVNCNVATAIYTESGYLNSYGGDTDRYTIDGEYIILHQDGDDEPQSEYLYKILSLTQEELILRAIDFDNNVEYYKRLD